MMDSYQLQVPGIFIPGQRAQVHPGTVHEGLEGK